MKALVQRVTSASVTVDGKVISSIGRGICVLLGISRKDTRQDTEWMTKKLLNLRIFDNPDNQKPWDKNIVDLGLEILCVSQFTLCHVLKGNKPDFHNAMNSVVSQPMYDEFLIQLGSLYNPAAVKGAIMMQWNLLLWDTRKIKHGHQDAYIFVDLSQMVSTARDISLGGQFGAFMQVHIDNDGPVTLDLETPQFPPSKERKPQPPKSNPKANVENDENEVKVK